MQRSCLHQGGTLFKPANQNKLNMSQVKKDYRTVAAIISVVTFFSLAYLILPHISVLSMTGRFIASSVFIILVFVMILVAVWIQEPGIFRKYFPKKYRYHHGHPLGCKCGKHLK